MAKNIFLWGFCSFLFSKIALDASFSDFHSVSIIASLLLGAMIGLSVFYSARFYAIEMGKHLVRIKYKQKSDFYGHALVIWSITALLNIMAGKAIVFGFAKKLNRVFDNALLFETSSRHFPYFSNEVFVFSAIIATPLTIHFLMVLFGVKAQAKIVETGV